jgi:DNA/RNA endonuclease YhcR with UshA esterase domain
MEEKTLLKLALISALAGIALLWLISQQMHLEETHAKDITQDMLEADVKITGMVNRVTSLEKILLIELMQPQTITVLLFKENQDMSLKPGDYIEAYGRLEEYNSKPELVGNLVKKV